MVQKLKGSTGHLAKRKAPRQRRRGGETAIEACVCEVDLKDSDPIESFNNPGFSGGSFRPVYTKGPKCTGGGCKIDIAYQWTLVSSTPERPGDQAPAFRGDTTKDTCNVVRPGRIKLKLEVNVTCERAGEGGIFRQSFCSDSGEAAFRIP